MMISGLTSLLLKDTACKLGSKLISVGKAVVMFWFAVS
jgi:hypothetical protein